MQPLNALKVFLSFNTHTHTHQMHTVSLSSWHVNSNYCCFNTVPYVVQVNIPKRAPDHVNLSHLYYDVTLSFWNGLTFHQIFKRILFQTNYRVIWNNDPFGFTVIRTTDNVSIFNTLPTQSGPQFNPLIVCCYIPFHPNTYKNEEYLIKWLIVNYRLNSFDFICSVWRSIYRNLFYSSFRSLHLRTRYTSLIVSTFSFSLSLSFSSLLFHSL
jgi:hypothetical protein